MIMPKKQNEKNTNDMKSLFTIIDNFYFKRNGTHLSENVRKKMVLHSKIKQKELEEERQQEENGAVAARPATSDKTQLTSSGLEDDEQEEKVESNKKDNKGSEEDLFDLSTPSVKLPLKVRKSCKIVDRYPAPACLVVSCLPPLKLFCHLSRLFHLVLI